MRDTRFKRRKDKDQQTVGEIIIDKPRDGIPEELPPEAFSTEAAPTDKSSAPVSKPSTKTKRKTERTRSKRPAAVQNGASIYCNFTVRFRGSNGRSVVENRVLDTLCSDDVADKLEALAAEVTKLLDTVRPTQPNKSS